MALYKNGIWVDSLHFNPVTQFYEGSNHLIESGYSYQLVIKETDSPTITATTTVPHPIEIIRIDTMWVLPSEFQSDTLMQVNMVFSDPPNESDFYELFVNPADNNNTIVTTYTIAPNGILENTNPGTFSIPSYFSDRLFDGETICMNLAPSWNPRGFPIRNWGSFIVFCLAHVSEEEYKFQKSIEQYYTINGVGIIEAVPVFGNIHNGAGILSSMAESYDTLWLNR